MCSCWAHGNRFLRKRIRRLAITVAFQDEPKVDVRDVLDQRGTVMDDIIGDRTVELTWNGSSLALEVDGSPVTDLDHGVIVDESVTIKFEAYEGRGTLGSTGTMGLEGWVYLDDFGRVRLDLRVPGNAALFELDSSGQVAVPPHGLVCRCQNSRITGCNEDACDGGWNCPGSTISVCGYFSGTYTEFVAGFEVVTEVE